MTEDNKKKVAEIGGEEDIVRRLFYLVFDDRSVGVVCGHATVALVGTVTKLCVDRAEDLLRGGGRERICEARAGVV